MTLSYCHHLTNLPDFTEIPNLEYLYLNGCVNLVEVHPSVGLLKRLIYLSLKNCYNLRSFPDKVQMDSLRHLIIWGCSKVENWPKVLGKIKTLIELGVDLPAINEPPSIVSSISNLQSLLIHGHERIRSRWRNSEFQPSSSPSKWHHPQSFVIPSFASLHFLKHLHVSNCNISEVSSDIFEALSCLEELDLHGNSFSSLPASLSQLNQLEYLDISDCEKLEVLPEIPPKHMVAPRCTMCGDDYQSCILGIPGQWMNDSAIQSVKSQKF
ncbi:Leucine-rich repeat-containing protein, partial [Cynara cardunculus var. scolymus]